jgi:hypothetical protein
MATSYVSGPGKEEMPLLPNEKELRQQLIEQFYERSVVRYGIDSEQACMLSGLLSTDTNE